MLYYEGSCGIYATEYDCLEADRKERRLMEEMAATAIPLDASKNPLQIVISLDYVIAMEQLAEIYGQAGYIQITSEFTRSSDKSLLICKLEEIGVCFEEDPTEGTWVQSDGWKDEKWYKWEDKR